jgi:hypothetical protein
MLKDASGYTRTHNAEKAAVNMEGEVEEQNIAKCTVIGLDKHSILVFYEDSKNNSCEDRVAQGGTN